jgi:hypothetical protein
MSVEEIIEALPKIKFEIRVS